MDTIRIRSLGLLVFLFFIAKPATCQPALEELKAKAAKVLDCTIDKELGFEMALDTAVRLKVRKNDLGIGEVFLYPRSNPEEIWVCAFDASDKEIFRRKRPYRKAIGVVDQPGRGLPYAVITKWRVNEKTVDVRLVVSTDKARNRDELEAAYAALNTKDMIAWSVRDNTFHLPLRISSTDRLSGFIRFWTEVKCNFAFFERMPDLNWDQVLTDYLPRIEKAETLKEYGDIMDECAALLKDGHTEYYRRDGRDVWTPPVRIRCIDGKAIVEELIPDSGSEFDPKSLRLGEEILTVDGVDVRGRLEKSIYPHICASTPQARDLRAYNELLHGDYGSVATLIVKNAEGTREVKLKRTSILFPKRNEFVFKKIGDDIGYVNLPHFGDVSIADQFDGLKDKLQGIRGLIIDVRLNGGGNDAFGNRIISRLIDAPLQDVAWKTREYRPSFRAWGQKERWYKGDQEHVKPAAGKYFLGPIVVLTGPETCSAGEDFAVVLHAGKRATLVGERTNGSTGQPLYIDLPMGAKARICTKWDTYPDGREFVGVGVIPDVEIGPSPQDIASGRDAVLEKGIEVLKELMGGQPK